MDGGQNSECSGQAEEFDDHDLDDTEIYIIIAWLDIVVMDMSLHTIECIRDSQLLGAQWIRELLCGYSDRVYKVFRLERHVFLNLCDLMRVRGWLKDSHYIKVDEQVGIFLSLVGHGKSNRYLCERFQHSGQTISTYFTDVLKVLLKLSKEIIRSPSFDDIPEEILMDRNHRRYFTGCIGVIEGTHIHAFVPVSMQISYRGRKGTTTQNVLCICSFDMKFNFVYAGWEGSANDCRVLSALLETPRLQFARPPPGKYYVVDSGYAALLGFLTPFKGEMYQLNDYRGRGRRPKTARELFNHRHSSLKNVIERLFEALKNRFDILRHVPPFTLRKQARIVIACCALHNYIRDQDKMDMNFSRYDDLEYACGPIQEEVVNDIFHEEASQINMLRKCIANGMEMDNNMDEIP